MKRMRAYKDEKERLRATKNSQPQIQVDQHCVADKVRPARLGSGGKNTVSRVRRDFASFFLRSTVLTTSFPWNSSSAMTRGRIKTSKVSLQTRLSSLDRASCLGAQLIRFSCYYIYNLIPGRLLQEQVQNGYSPLSSNDTRPLLLPPPPMFQLDHLHINVPTPIFVHILGRVALLPFSQMPVNFKANLQSLSIFPLVLS